MNDVKGEGDDDFCVKEDVPCVVCIQQQTHESKVFQTMCEWHVKLVYCEWWKGELQLLERWYAEREKALLRGAQCSSGETGGRGVDSGKQLVQYRNSTVKGHRLWLVRGVEEEGMNGEHECMEKGNER